MAEGRYVRSYTTYDSQCWLGLRKHSMQVHPIQPSVSAEMKLRL